MTEPYTLFVFAGRDSAKRNGFTLKSNQSHPTRENWQAWWPNLGEMPICARNYATVIYVDRFWWDYVGTVERIGMFRALIRSRTMVYGDKAVIIEPA